MAMNSSMQTNKNKTIAPYEFNAQKMSLNQLGRKLGWQMPDNITDDMMVTGINQLKQAENNQLIYINHADYIDDLWLSQSQFCLLTAKLRDKAQAQNSAAEHNHKILILCDDPRAEWALAAKLLYPTYPFIDKQQESVIASDALIGKNTVIDDNSTVSSGCNIGPNCSIINSFIGKNAIIGSNVSLHHCHIGDDNVILSGVTLGEEGFGIIPATAQHHTIPMPQIGNLVTGKQVLIGSNSTIDRATIGSTFIGNHTKIDSNVHIGHNVEIGENCLIVACCGIGGSAKIGNNVAVGGCSTVLNHVKIVDGVEIGAGTVVYKDVLKKQLMWGIPARPFVEQARLNLLLEKMLKKQTSR